MAPNKTAPNDLSVDDFIASVADERKQRDCRELLDLMREITGAEAKMWGGSLIGFGQYHYKYASGREGEWFYTGFSPRKQNLTMYIMDGFDSYDEKLAQLGKHKTGKSCLYVKTLDDVDRDVLKDMIESSVKHQKQKYES